MNYARIYGEFIENRRLREPGLTGYVETHHILPRSVGGGNEAENLIRLTAEDHFFAHLLLAKTHGGAMWAALHAMCVGRKHSGKRYLKRMRKHVAKARELAGRRHSKVMKGRFAGEKHPMYGRPCSELAKQKTREIHASGKGPMASAEIRKKVSEALMGRTFSEEHRAKISRSKMGQRRSAESCRKQSATMTGRTLSPEVVEKVRIANTGKKRTAAQNLANSQARIGKPLPEATRVKLVEAIRRNGHPRGMLGKSHAPEYKRMMASFNAGKRAYASKFNVPCRTVTKAMLAAAGMWDS